MGMAADQLRGARLGDGADIALAPLLEQEREEDDLEEDVTELVEHRLGVAAPGGIGELVGLLDGVRDDRSRVLLAVPRALAAKPPRDLVEASEGGLRVGVQGSGRAPLGATGRAEARP